MHAITRHTLGHCARWSQHVSMSRCLLRKVIFSPYLNKKKGTIIITLWMEPRVPLRNALCTDLYASTGQMN